MFVAFHLSHAALCALKMEQGMTELPESGRCSGMRLGRTRRSSEK
jgi:hypothetical protein